MKNLIINEFRKILKSKLLLGFLFSSGLLICLNIIMYNPSLGYWEIDIDKIFIPLYKVDKSRTSDKNSMGLGLAIVKNIVDNIGGTIKVQSKLGEFTIFTIEIPVFDI